ncbi:MAG: type II secretion system protein [Candidatus Moraniibacteriota bacterium]
MRKKNLRGFTLIELIVSMGVFIVMITTVSATFASGFASYGNARDLERDVESAQYAMNTLAKYLRTSTIIDSTPSSVVFYDYSSNRCFEYEITGAGVLQARMKDIVSYSQCSVSVLGSPFDLTTGYVSGEFVVDPSVKSPKHMGRVTLYLDIRKSPTSTMSANVQTTVSLRDYQFLEN